MHKNEGMNYWGWGNWRCGWGGGGEGLWRPRGAADRCLGSLFHCWSWFGWLQRSFSSSNWLPSSSLPLHSWASTAIPFLGITLLHCLFLFSKFSSFLQHRSSCIPYMGLPTQILFFSHLAHVSWVSLAPAWVSLPVWRLHIHQVKCKPFQVFHSTHGCRQCRVSLLVPVRAQVWRMEWVECLSHQVF